MNFIKNIIVVTALIFAGWFVWDKVTQTPCDHVIKYDISFDDRFRITENEFLTYIERAESQWEDVVGRELFRYVPGADFKINLIYGREQERLYESRDLSKNLDSQQSDLDSLQSRYQTAVRRYESALQDYQRQVEQYESQVEHWNSKGGAPTNIYKTLQQESRRLDQQFKDVEKLRIAVNNLAEENNVSIKNFNNNVKDFNNLVGEPKEFDAGNTDGTEINIYSYDGNQELMTVLTHEFGHVLGIDHLDDESAVMYYLLNSKNKGGILRQSDINALNLSCHLK